MIKIENIKVYGWEAAIRGMRNPKNSWARSDSGYTFKDADGIKHICGIDDGDCGEWVRCEKRFFSIGENDHKLMMQLAKAGPEHAKYLRYITVTVDLTGPLYWYKEMDCYRAGVEHNSCSTMHKIAAKEFTWEDFSCEHLDGWAQSVMRDVLDLLNSNRVDFIETKSKSTWWQMIQMLPSSYNQRRTYQFSYQALANIYRQRRNHKLDEWHTFCDWIEGLPYSELITGVEK